MIRFAHLSDCHIGGWTEPALMQLSISSFAAAVDQCIAEKVDFVLISGDLFNTSVPSVDALKMVASSMKKLRDLGIRIYVIPGSHDYSPSGKTMIDVLEKTGMCVNLFHFDKATGKLRVTIDPETNTLLTGIAGLRGGLESQYYAKLDRAFLEHSNHQGLKIFLFHTLLTEFKPTDFDMIDSEPLHSLPKGFHYYAGGHPHFVSHHDKRKEGYGIITYPGPLFPNNFKELEKLSHGGFYIVTVADNYKITLQHIPLILKAVVSFTLDATGKTAPETEALIRTSLSSYDLTEKIVTLRITGTLSEGKPSDINFKQLTSHLPAYAFLKNTAALTSIETLHLAIKQGSVEDIETELTSHCPLPSLFPQPPPHFIKDLLILLNKEKYDGERSTDFHDRITSDIAHYLHIEHHLKNHDP